LVLFFLTACTAGDAPGNRPSMIKLPDMGVSYLALCDGDLFSPRKSRASYTFRTTDEDTLRIEVWRDERLSWTEMRAADYGINLPDRTYAYDEGYRDQVNEIKGLEEVRKLVPGARAEGQVYEREAGNRFEYAFIADVLKEEKIDHAFLGERIVIPIRSSHTWVSGGSTRQHTSYVDITTGEIVRIEFVSTVGWALSCDLAKT
jgi:hypothetical protein